MMTETGSFQWHPVTGQEAMDTNWHRKGSIGPSGNIFLTLKVSKHWHRLLSECLWSFPSWRSSKATLTWSWEACGRWLCLNKRVGQDDSQRPLQPQLFCEAVNSSWTHGNMPWIEETTASMPILLLMLDAVPRLSRAFRLVLDWFVNRNCHITRSVWKVFRAWQLIQRPSESERNSLSKHWLEKS